MNDDIDGEFAELCRSSDTLAELVRWAEYLHNGTDLTKEENLREMWNVMSCVMWVAAVDRDVPRPLRLAFARVVWDITPEQAAEWIDRAMTPAEAVGDIGFGIGIGN